MKKTLVLIGNEGKRKDFFLDACRTEGVECLFLDMKDKDLVEKIGEGMTIKIDPPVYTSSDLNRLNPVVDDYIGLLRKLKEKNVNFLNSPQSLINTLDKKKTKEILSENNIASTEVVDINNYDYDGLVESLERKRINDVFIKPNYGSGAAGIIIFRYNRRLKRSIIYTTIYEKSNKFNNIKKVVKIGNEEKIRRIVNFIMKDKPIVEKLIRKHKYRGLNYDIRVLVQDKKVKFMVGRSSKTPITNLHLADGAVDIKDLNLADEKVRQIKNLAIEGVGTIEGLNVAGVDILLDRKLNPYIIEINGQGDLIYKDIYNENSIYKDQVRLMKNKGGIL